jgi:Uma2 family endonuclease
MGTAQIAPLTVEHYRQLPEGGPRYQLIEGDLYMAPAPNRYHQDISRNLLLIIGTYLLKHPIGTVYSAPFDVFLDEINAHQPDILYVAKKNRILTHAGAEGAPDFIVEILSPKTAHLDKDAKRRVFARRGVKELWIIDPNTKLIDVYFLQKHPEKPTATYRETDTWTSPHFPGLKIKGKQIFKHGGFDGL